MTHSAPNSYSGPAKNDDHLRELYRCTASSPQSKVFDDNCAHTSWQQPDMKRVVRIRVSMLVHSGGRDLPSHALLMAELGYHGR